MALELARVHVFAQHRDPLTGEVSQRLVDYNPYLSLKSGEDPAVFIQRGKLYGQETGELSPDEVPEWFAEELAKCTPESLRAVGWLVDEDATGQPDVPVPPPVRDPAAVRKRELIDALMERLPMEELIDLLHRTTQPGGSPQTPVYDLDPDDFPPDADDEAPPAERATLLPSIPPDPTVRMWTCEDCGESMKLQVKGFHIANHRRQAAAQE